MEDSPLARVRAAYAPDAFRAQGHAVVDQLADYLGRATSGVPIPVLPWVAPEDQLGAWPFEARDLPSLLARVVERSNHLHHPRYVGHQVTAPLPAAALCDMASALLNNGSAIYEMGPVSTALERLLVGFFARTLGLAAGADGFLTSGGSAGNLTALLAARQAKAGFDVWTAGALGGPQLAVLASEQAHYSISRAARIMGLGAKAVITVPVDARYRMRADALVSTKRVADDAGMRVIAVVASAGSTATGAYDPLGPVADFCEAHDLWLHVDGAHGAAAAFSSRHGARLKGIERADSVILDAHKMLLMPALVTAVLFREARRSHSAFAQDASYLFASHEADPPWWDLAARTLECTKTMMSLKLYAALALHGPGFFAEYVDGMFALAQGFADRIEAASDFELPVRPECNIVCFRYRPAGCTGPALDHLQVRIRQKLVTEGQFYLVQTTLPTGVHLRVTLVNPFTDDADLGNLLSAVRKAAST